eukprot:GFUD01009312.1.p1 GENE.GFUD01009312.1~~GFUD01009312.1.p1  ORF type:complete len:281 (+),score=64.49 GFUD01009312.1:77-919(+)
MASKLLLCFLLVTTSIANPQRNSQDLGRPTGQEFVDLLYEDFTNEEYQVLLDEFVEFLQVKELRSKGDFVDYERMECTPKIGKYKVEDPVQCDKFHECDTNGKLTEKLCPDGFVYDIPGHSCNHPQRVECKDRTGELQEPQVFPGCPRRNGYFNPPEAEKCDEYVGCVDGLATAGKCSTGVVWSPPILSCTLPAQSGRPECIAAVVKEFDCPPIRGALRFGNHDRHADPADCGKFFVCLANGSYNKASCDAPRVFSEKAGACLEAKDVKGCEDYNKKDEE